MVTQNPRRFRLIKGSAATIRQPVPTDGSSTT